MKTEIKEEIVGKRILCPGCNKPIHINDFGAATGDGKGGQFFWHSFCYVFRKK